MHLIFERSRGKFGSNCNILALAWMPYHQESQFRQALLDYHQRQLHNLTRSVRIDQQQPRSGSSGENIGSLARHHRDILQNLSSPSSHHRGGTASTNGQNEPEPDRQPAESAFVNARVAELHQRYLFLKEDRPVGLTNSTETTANLSGSHIGDELDKRYGRMRDFGWLAVGNIGRIVGVTLTSTIDPPEWVPKYHGQRKKGSAADLITFEDDTENQTQLAAKQVDSFDLRRPDRPSARTNYNLRGHTDEVILVKWNELYQKLATVDTKGNVLFWCKVNEKFTIQTPFYNRTKSVADFKWSNDGKTALICYTDSFILVGSSTGQRTWHSMLNLEDYHITCASWTPNDEQLLLGVSNGNVVVIDLASSFLTELTIDRVNIRTMCWSTSNLSLRHLDKLSSGSSNGNPRRSRQNQSKSHRGNNRNPSIVNRRRLSRDCSLFYKYKFCVQGPNELGQSSGDSQLPTQNGSPGGTPRKSASRNHRNCNQRNDGISMRNILAIDFANSTIKLFDGGLDDQEPKTIQVHQESYIMQWSSDGEILAVAGFNIHTTAPSVGHLRCRYSNAIKFYNQKGKLVHEHVLNFRKFPITAFTWAHDDKRIFVATGPRLHCAKVFFGVSSLSLLASSCLQRHTRLPNKPEVIENILRGQFGKNVFSWQSHNCTIDIEREARRLAASGGALPTPDIFELEDVEIVPDERPALCNNSNVYTYHLPLKLRSKMDKLFSQTLHQPFEDPWTLSDIIWHVPRDERRYYCTLICYTCEREIGSSGYQFRSELMNRVSESNNVSSDQNKIFVLYVEFEGSLIPILRARRIGFLKPEFVIFDPEDYPTRLAKHKKVSDLSQLTSSSRKATASSSGRQVVYSDDISGSEFSWSSSFNVKDALAMNCVELHNYAEPRTSNASIGKQSLSEIEHYYNFESDTDNRRIQSKLSDLMMNSRSHHQEPIPSAPSASIPLTSDEHLLYMMSMQNEFRQQPSSKYSQLATTIGSCNLKRAMEKFKMEANSLSSRQRGDNLPENKELVRIKSNIWGTKFKMINRSNRVIRQRAILGSVLYKASILHLQPRQIFLNLKDMTNYCCLCSKHHHCPNTRSARTQQWNRNAVHKQTSLIDLPSNFRDRRLSNDTDKVLLPVGGSLKIAPKLESNQRYKFVNERKSTQKPPTKRNHHSASETHSRFIDKNPIVPINQSSSHNPRAHQAGHTEDDDILTLSLGQDDCLQVGMSKPSNSSAYMTQNNQKMDAFLSTNKTLKSIQTITKMIVDLSSKANDLDATNGDKSGTLSGSIATASTNKLVGLYDEPDAGATITRFVYPETPVHRPNRKATKQRKLVNGDFLVSQSSNTTPLRPPRTSRGRRSGQQNAKLLSIEPTHPLPPPPPAVPLGRKLSSSAKRFLDGSLRSLYSYGTGTFSTASSDVETEDSEPLVTRSRNRIGPGRASRPARGQPMSNRSQPASPMRSFVDWAQRRDDDGAASLRSHLMQKLRSGMDEGLGVKKRPALSASLATKLRLDSTGSGRSHSATNRREAMDDSSFFASSGDQSDSDASLSSFSDSDSNEDQDKGAKTHKLSRQQRRFLSSERRPGGGKFCSLTPTREPLVASGGSREGGQQTSGGCEQRLRPKTQRLTDNNDISNAKGARHRRRKSFCLNRNCCCAREFKLSNRPPIWNELSQVYQLDFGGRVTQESAKNLQIDFEGNMALQFGRIDKSTYTLDYRYPFNAVQAMAIALASLTQRLK